LPPEFFAELLKSLRAEWMEAGCDPSAATAAEEVALAAYNRNGARDNTDDAHDMAHSILQVAVRAIDCEVGLKVDLARVERSAASGRHYVYQCCSTHVV